MRGDSLLKNKFKILWKRRNYRVKEKKAYTVTSFV